MRRERERERDRQKWKETDCQRHGQGEKDRQTDSQRKSSRREKVIISAINTHKTSLSRKREQISEEMVKVYSSFTVNMNCMQSSKLSDAKTLNACKKCQLRLQILEQGKILRLDIVSPRYKVLLRNSRRQPFTGSHTFDHP